MFVQHGLFCHLKGSHGPWYAPWIYKQDVGQKGLEDSLTFLENNLTFHPKPLDSSQTTWEAAASGVVFLLSPSSPFSLHFFGN